MCFGISRVTRVIRNVVSEETECVVASRAVLDWLSSRGFRYCLYCIGRSVGGTRLRVLFELGIWTVIVTPLSCKIIV